MNDPIKHVVVLMLENNSFDRMLGAFQAIYPNLEGVPPNGSPRTNSDGNQDYPQAPTEARVVHPDPRHELDHVLRQIEVPPPKPWELSGPISVVRVLESIWALLKVAWSWLTTPKRPKMMEARAATEGKFVLDYAESYPRTTKDQRQEIMGYYRLDSLFALHPLARDFTICDQWFSSVPGPTWANRMYALSGTSNGLVQMPESRHDWKELFKYNQDTIFDRLNEKGISWHVYYGDFPLSGILMHQWEKPNALRYRPMDCFYEAAEQPEAAFPAFAFIEPRYMLDPNDDHPDHDIFKGQHLIAKVYNALRGNDELWKSTLLVITYDEHGGFYDHVPPPLSVAPDDRKMQYIFDRLGVRVPAVLVSPWVERGVVSTVFDHTSILKYLIEKWKLAPLGERVAQANSIGDVIRTTGEPRQDATPPISVPTYAPQEVQPTEPNAHQKAMLAFRQHMEAEGKGPKMMRATREGPVSVQDEMNEAAGWMQAFLESGGQQG